MILADEDTAHTHMEIGIKRRLLKPCHIFTMHLLGQTVEEPSILV